MNFTGAGVVASVVGGVATVAVSGGGGGSSFTQIEIDYGSIPTHSAVFLVTDAAVSPSSKLIAVQAGDAPTARSADENEMDPQEFSAEPGSGSFTLRAFARFGPVVGKYKVNYAIG